MEGLAGAPLGAGGGDVGGLAGSPLEAGGGDAGGLAISLLWVGGDVVDYDAVLLGAG